MTIIKRTGGASTQNYHWPKADLSTPLNKMSTGTSTNWAHSADTVTVTVPTQATPFNRDTLNHLHQGIPNIQHMPPPQRARPQVTPDTTGKGAHADAHAHPVLLRPTPPTLAIIDAAARIISTPPGNLKPGDLMVPRSSIGTTVAVAILMGRVRDEILPGLTDIHAHNLAHILMSTNPWILLDHLNDHDKFAAYISNIRVKDKPSSLFIETEMCPDRTPLAIRNTYLRGRIDLPTLK